MDKRKKQKPFIQSPGGSFNKFKNYNFNFYPVHHDFQ